MKRNVWIATAVAFTVGLITSVVCIGLFHWSQSIHEPSNTDPRKGRVIIYDPGYGNPRDWKECADTTLIISIQGVEHGDRYIDDSPECQP